MKKILAIGAIAVLSLVFLAVPQKTKAAVDNTWTKNATIVNASGQAGWSRVIKDGSTYKMWVEDPADFTIRYATSTDGKAWGALQATNLLAADTVHEFCVVKDGATYKMWYNTEGAGVVGVGYRTSADGLTWSGLTQVVLTGGGQAWDLDYIAPWVIKDGSTYKMWYNAAEAAGRFYLAYATSNDGTNFTEPQNLGRVISAAGNTNNNLVIKQGAVSTWDGYQNGEPMYSNVVLKNSDGLYEMWYAGTKSGEAAGVNGFRIGYATSPNGIAWTEFSGNPIFSGTPGGYDANGVFYPTVIQDGDTYKMWYWRYAGFGIGSGGVGYAEARKLPVAAAETLPETGSHNVALFTGLVILGLSLPAFYIFQHQEVKS